MTAGRGIVHSQDVRTNNPPATLHAIFSIFETKRQQNPFGWINFSLHLLLLIGAARCINATSGKPHRFNRMRLHDSRAWLDVPTTMEGNLCFE